MLKEEMKKIWRPGILAILILLGFVYYTMYLEFYIQYFPNGPEYKGIYQVAADWVKRFGTTLEPEEEAQAAREIPVLVSEASACLSTNPVARQYGLSSYEEYENFYNQSVRQVQGELTAQEQERYADAKILSNYLTSEETDNIEGRIYATRLFTQMYELWEQEGVNLRDKNFVEGYTQREYTHAEDSFFGADHAWRNILPAELPEAFSNYLGYLLIWVCISSCLLLSPVPVRDRMRSMRPLQWSSRHGRKILRTQFAASMLSGAALTAVNLLIFGGLFMTHGIHTFFGCRIYSFMHTGFSWINPTFGTWCLLLVLLIYLTGMGISAIAFFLSMHSTNYVAMLLKMIPLVILTALLCPRLLTRLFYYGNSLYQLTNIPGIEGYTALLILAAGLILFLITRHRQKRQELLL